VRFALLPELPLGTAGIAAGGEAVVQAADSNGTASAGTAQAPSPTAGATATPAATGTQGARQ